MSVWCWFQDEEDLGRFVTICPRRPHPHRSRCGLFSISVPFCQSFFPEWSLNLFVSTIRQVVWLSPGTLGQAGVGSAMGFPVRIEGTGTGIKIQLVASVVSCGNRRQEQGTHRSRQCLVAPRACRRLVILDGQALKI